MKKLILLSLISISLINCASSQSVAINNDGSLADPNAALDIKSGIKGLLIPRMDSVSRKAIPNTKGLLVYDSTTNSFWYNDSTKWINLASNLTGWSTKGNSGTSSANNFIGTTDNTALVVKVNNILSGTINPINYNTSWGANALLNNTTGVLNVAIGNDACLNNTTGIRNTAIGPLAMGDNNTGSYNVAIGNLAGWSGSGIPQACNNRVSIGAQSYANADNKVRIGDVNITAIEGQVPFTTPSDGRFKFNIKENVKGLDFILSLRPVTYQFDVKKQDAFVKGLIKPSELVNYPTSVSNDEATEMIRTGFIAQEVEDAAKKAGFNFDGIKVPKTDKEYYSLSYASFVVPLVKAVQEQQETINNLQAKITELEKRFEELKKSN